MYKKALLSLCCGSLKLICHPYIAIKVKGRHTKDSIRVGRHALHPICMISYVRLILVEKLGPLCVIY